MMKPFQCGFLSWMRFVLLEAMNIHTEQGLVVTVAVVPVVEALAWDACLSEPWHILCSLCHTLP